jgi:hypothetical protein
VVAVAATDEEPRAVCRKRCDQPSSSAREKLTLVFGGERSRSYQNRRGGQRNPGLSVKTQTKSKRYPYVNKICVSNVIGWCPEPTCLESNRPIVSPRKTQTEMGKLRFLR